MASVKNKETLEKAADLIQSAHDYIEINGFDISQYRPRPFSLSDDRSGPCCYIGTLRNVAGIDPSPGCGDAGAGDGPELIEALDQLDRIAKRRMNSEDKRGVKNDFETPTGRFVESLGFNIRTRAFNKHPGDWNAMLKYEQEYALKLLRKALTDIYAEVK